MIEEIINKMNDKLGDSKDLITDNIAELLSFQNSNNEELSNKNKEIEDLKKRNQTLTDVNANLLRSIPTGKKEEPVKEEPKKEFSLKDCFDERGNFKK